MDTQHGRRRVCKLTLDGTQTAKCWIQLGYAKEGLVMTKLETDAERTERHAITNADTGKQWDSRGNPIPKGSPQRRADATRRVKARKDQGGSGPITDADIPFAS